MKKFISVLLTCIFLVALCSCTTYKSDYDAVKMTTSSGGDHCKASFSSLEGTLVLNAKMQNGAAEGEIHYKASLDEGELYVYYDAFGTKELLFSLKGGETIDAHGGYVENGQKVTIIIETVGAAKNGEIYIDFEQK